MDSMFDILKMIVGQPADDLQATVLYFAAACIGVIFFYFILYLFRLTAKLIK